MGGWLMATIPVTKPKTLAEMGSEVDLFCKAKGWRDSPVSFGEAMALLHSEVSEALEAYRRIGFARDGSYDDVGAEFADIFIRLLDDCQRWGINLEAEYERKMAYNHQRSYRHGGKRL